MSLITDREKMDKILNDESLSKNNSYTRAHKETRLITSMTGKASWTAYRPKGAPEGAKKVPYPPTVHVEIKFSERAAAFDVYIHELGEFITHVHFNGKGKLMSFDGSIMEVDFFNDELPVLISNYDRYEGFDAFYWVSADNPEYNMYKFMDDLNDILYEVYDKYLEIYKAYHNCEPPRTEPRDWVAETSHPSIHDINKDYHTPACIPADTTFTIQSMKDGSLRLTEVLEETFNQLKIIKRKDDEDDQT